LSTNSINTNSCLLNPVTLYRDIGADELKKQLMFLELKDLLKIIRTYTPDLNGKIYREKNIVLVIDYIIDRASKLSRIGHVFRSE
jgi:hypothetical protein